MNSPTRPLQRRIGIIVVAGGRGRRMGGVNKAALYKDGRRLIDFINLGIDEHVGYGTPRSIVSAYFLGMPQVAESPLFGGPAAAVEAGFDAIERRFQANSLDAVGIVCVDSPDAPALLPQLSAALVASPNSPGAFAVSPDGRAQFLCALWRTSALRDVFTDLRESNQSLHNAPARALYERARLLWVQDFVELPSQGLDFDLDTPQDFVAWAQGS